MDQTGALANAKLLDPGVKTIGFQNGLPSPSQEAHRRALAEQGLFTDITFGFSAPARLAGPLAGNRFLLTGSLKSNLVPLRRKRNHNSVLFVSQWRTQLVQTAFYDSERVLLPRLANWAEHHQLEMVILGYSGDTPREEFAFYTQILGTQGFRFVQKDASKFSAAYIEIDSAQVVVTVHSTLGVEAMFRGKQAFFFSNGLSRFFHHVAREKTRGPFWVTDGDIDGFCDLLDDASSGGGDRDFRLSSEALSEDWHPDSGLVRTRQEILRLCPGLATDIVTPSSRVFWKSKAEIE